MKNQGGVKLDKKYYDELKSVDYSKLESQLEHLIKVKERTGSYFYKILSIGVLALIEKEVTEENEITLILEEKITNKITQMHLKKIIKDYYEDIIRISNSYNKDEIKAMILFGDPYKYEVNADISNPEGISNLAIELLELKKEDSLLDLGSGINSFLIDAAIKKDIKNISGVEVNTENIIIANIRGFVAGTNINNIQNNILSEDFSEIGANKVFSFPPLGLRYNSLKRYLDGNENLKKYFKDSKKVVSGDWIFSIAAYINTKEPGKTVVVITNSGTWNMSDIELRKEFLEAGIIEGVILLPENLLSNTGIPVSLLILSKNNKKIKLVDASNIYTEGRRQNSLKQKDVDKIMNAYNNITDISKLVSVEDLSKDGYILNPQRYLNEDIEMENSISFEKLALSINRGSMIRSKDLDKLVSKEETNYKYLMLKNIQDGVIDSELPSLIEIDKNNERYCIKNNNLIISKNSPYKVATAKVKENENILANGNLYFIELDSEKINPIFVEIYLQSESGISQLNRLSKGTTIKNLSITDLKQVRIPKISREDQDKIVEEYENISEQLKLIDRQKDLLLDKKDRILEGVI